MRVIGLVSSSRSSAKARRPRHVLAAGVYPPAVRKVEQVWSQVCSVAHVRTLLCIAHVGVKLQFGFGQADLSLLIAGNRLTGLAGLGVSSVRFSLERFQDIFPGGRCIRVCRRVCGGRVDPAHTIDCLRVGWRTGQGSQTSRQCHNLAECSMRSREPEMSAGLGGRM